METPTRPNTAYQKMLAEGAKRHAEAKAMFLAGKSIKEIGDHFGVTRQRAHQMVHKAAKETAA